MEKIEQLRQLKKAIEQEFVERTKVMNSDEYMELERHANALKAKMDLMVADVPDSRAEYELVKADVMLAMREQGVFNIENVFAKLKEKKEVNSSRVLNTLGGDVDAYIAISSVTQVALKDFAKSNPAMKDALMDCIEVVSKEIIDLEIAD